MSIDTLTGLAAYGRAAVPRADNGAASPPAAGASSPDFGAMIGTLVADTAGTLHAAETAGARQVAGKGDLIDVVTAIGSAELALNTVVAVRDRVVNAYNDIMRMQV